MSEPRLRRRDWPVWARAPALILVYVLLWPISKLLELFGLWPQLMSRGMARMMDRFKGYEPDEHDVLVCSYFKAGTNWTMQIAVQIAHRGGANFEHIHDVVPWLELPLQYRYAVALSDERLWQEAPTGLRVIKTHLPLSKLSYTPSARYIWVVRDPKDVFVSSYRFQQSVVMGPLMPSVGKWLELYLSDDTYFGSWAEHLQGGWQARNHDNVLFLTFEQIKADLPGTVARIAEFMRIDLTEAELSDVVRQSSFEHMKSIEHKFDTVGLSPPWVTPRGAMIRRGQIGSAAELLSPADQQRIDDYWRAELEKLGSDFPYDEAFLGEGLEV